MRRRRRQRSSSSPLCLSAVSLSSRPSLSPPLPLPASCPPPSSPASPPRKPRWAWCAWPSQCRRRSRPSTPPEPRAMRRRWFQRPGPALPAAGPLLRRLQTPAGPRTCRRARALAKRCAGPRRAARPSIRQRSGGRTRPRPLRFGRGEGECFAAARGKREETVRAWPPVERKKSLRSQGFRQAAPNGGRKGERASQPSTMNKNDLFRLFDLDLLGPSSFSSTLTPSRSSPCRQQ